MTQDFSMNRSDNNYSTSIVDLKKLLYFSSDISESPFGSINFTVTTINPDTGITRINEGQPDFLVVDSELPTVFNFEISGGAIQLKPWEVKCRKTLGRLKVLCQALAVLRIITSQNSSR